MDINRIQELPVENSFPHVLFGHMIVEVVFK